MGLRDSPVSEEKQQWEAVHALIGWWRVLAAFLLVVLVWRGTHLVMRYVHKGQQDAVLQRMGLGDVRASYDDDGYVSHLS